MEGSNKKTNKALLDKQKTLSKEVSTLVSVVEYRKLLKDTKSTDEEIIARLQYLESLCRHIIQKELQDYAKKT
jgi:hypothetical protein